MNNNISIDDITIIKGNTEYYIMITQLTDPHSGTLFNITWRPATKLEVILFKDIKHEQNTQV